MSGPARERWDGLDAAVAALQQYRSAEELTERAGMLALEACAARSAVFGWLSADGTWAPSRRVGDVALLEPDRAPPPAVEGTVRCGGRAVARLRVEGEGIAQILVDAYVAALGSMCELIACRQRAGAQRQLLARARVLRRDPGDDPVSLIPDEPQRDVPGALGGPAPGRDALRERLTARQREVLDLMVSGRSNEEIAEHLVVAIPTVKSHVRAVLRTLGAVNRADAIARVGVTPRPNAGGRRR